MMDTHWPHRSSEHPVPNYTWHWAVVFLIVGLFLAYHHVVDQENFRNDHIVRTLSGPGSDWFLILRMPEVPSSVTDVEPYQQSFAERLDALNHEGFHPVLLSDIHRHIEKGVGLPAKPVVLLFDPGHRHTYDVLAPVLKRYKVPAVWLTDGDALNHSDRRYVSRHATHLMVHSGLWDVGLYREGGSVQIQNAEEGTWTLSADRSALWSPAAGVFAYNDANRLSSLNRLNVNAIWTPEEFRDRVDAEAPIRGPMRLTARPIHNHLWGLALPLNTADNTRFAIESNLEKRGNTIAWLGTHGIQNVQLDLSLENLTGELWILLRSDEDTGESVRVGFDDGLVLVDQQHDNHIRRLASAASSADRSLRARIRLEGSRLSVAVDGRSVLSVDALAPTVSKNDVLRLTVYDKLRGTAYAEVPSMTLTPLGREPSQ